MSRTIISNAIYRSPKLNEYTKYRCGLREDGSYYISDGYKHPNGYKRRYFSEDGLSEN